MGGKTSIYTLGMITVKAFPTLSQKTKQQFYLPLFVLPYLFKIPDNNFHLFPILTHIK